MITIVEDAFPGRCRNVRTIITGEITQALRCLDYEGTRHICCFPRPYVPPHSTDAFVVPKPKKWVKPSEDLAVGVRAGDE